MAKHISTVFKKKATENFEFQDSEFEAVGIKLKKNIDKVFGRSLAIRELDSGSDNSTEIELVNLTAPHYDIERFGITFVASPRHACGLGIVKDSYGVLGSADKIFDVDLKIPGNPPSPKDILKGMLALMEKIQKQKN